MTDYAVMRETLREIGERCYSLAGTACLRLGCSGSIRDREGESVCELCGRRYRNR